METGNDMDQWLDLNDPGCKTALSLSSPTLPSTYLPTYQRESAAR